MFTALLTEHNPKKACESYQEFCDPEAYVSNVRHSPKRTRGLVAWCDKGQQYFNRNAIQSFR